MIRAVLFDIDNTLTHRGRSVAAFSQQLADYYHVQLQSVNVVQIETIVNRIDNGGYPLKEHLTHTSIGASVAYALLQELSWNLAPDLNDLSNFWFEQFGRCAVAMPDAEQTLTHLKQAGYKLAIISNGGHATRLSILNGLGFAHYFDVINTSGLFGQAKPKPDIFIDTAQQLHVEVEQCLFVGDHPINDVHGAQQAGMQALWLSGFHQPLVTINAPQITALSEIFKYLTAMTDV
ncbi:HAD family hydrolase [Acinetobacter sp. TUM15064]|uniref:HAD family hydrolase n=1 Tax=Acinetobacter sp. TUM15064 TaxID=2609134 RepID=UPI00124CF79D|nr:HAD family hydrolase [Acinetobacter sp. TUM15064]